jgi:hypothetical protein
VTTSYGGREVLVIGRIHLIQNKRAMGRPQDLLDLEVLLPTPQPPRAYDPK